MLEHLGWPADKLFEFKDELGEHDPCYVIMPDGAALPLSHHATNGVDQARAKFIVDACNEKLNRSSDDWASGFCACLYLFTGRYSHYARERDFHFNR